MIPSLKYLTNNSHNQSSKKFVFIKLSRLQMLELYVSQDKENERCKSLISVLSAYSVVNNVVMKVVF